MSNKLKGSVIILLLLITGGLGYYTFNNSKKHDLIEAKMSREKESLLNDLSELKNQYTEEISKNTILSDDLAEQKDKITKLIDSIKGIKAANWKSMRFYKREIAKLKKTSSRLLIVNDSLVQSNANLNVMYSDLEGKADSLSINLQKQTTYNKTLVDQNMNLANKVALGARIKMSNFKVYSYKTRRDKQRETDKAKRVDAFKTSFTLAENPIAEKRNIPTHIVVTTPKGKLLLDRGTFTTNNGDELHYSDESTIPYKGKNVTKNALIKFGDVRLERGTYTFDFYIDNTLSKTIKKSLR